MQRSFGSWCHWQESFALDAHQLRTSNVWKPNYLQHDLITINWIFKGSQYCIPSTGLGWSWRITRSYDHVIICSLTTELTQTLILSHWLIIIYANNSIRPAISRLRDSWSQQQQHIDRCLQVCCRLYPFKTITFNTGLCLFEATDFRFGVRHFLPLPIH